MGWDPSSLAFYPNDVSELVRNSERLKEIATINGWTEEELTNQLVTRVCYLCRMLENNIKDFDIVTEELSKFYYDPLEKYHSVLNTKSLGEISNEKIASKRLANLSQ
jgi:flagellar protein FlaI